MKKDGKRLVTGLVAISVNICGIAHSQEVNQPRDVELGQTVYRTGLSGSSTIERNEQQDFVDRLSGTDRSLAQDARRRISAAAAQTSLMAEAPGAQSDPAPRSLVQDYIDRTSGRTVFRYQ